MGLLLLQCCISFSFNSTANNHFVLLFKLNDSLTVVGQLLISPHQFLLQFRNELGSFCNGLIPVSQLFHIEFLLPVDLKFQHFYL
jgi:hypothetical protein